MADTHQPATEATNYLTNRGRHDAATTELASQVRSVVDAARAAADTGAAARRSMSALLDSPVYDGGNPFSALHALADALPARLRPRVQTWLTEPSVRNAIIDARSEYLRRVGDTDGEGRAELSTAATSAAFDELLYLAASNPDAQSDAVAEGVARAIGDAVLGVQAAQRINAVVRPLVTVWLAQNHDTLTHPTFADLDRDAAHSAVEAALGVLARLHPTADHHTVNEVVYDALLRLDKNR